MSIIEITEVLFRDFWELKIFNIPIIQIKDKSKGKDMHIKFLPLKKGLREKFFRKIINQYPDYKDYYIIKQASGEPYLLTSFIDKVIEKNGNNKSLIFGIKPYHKNIFNMFVPNIDCRAVKHLGADVIPLLKKDKYTYKGRNFYSYLPGYLFNNFYTEALKDETNTMHYFDCILNLFGLKREDACAKQAVIPSNVYEKIEEQAKEVNLNLEKFVFLAPEAMSCAPYSDDFWIKLINKLKDLGFDIYLNSVKETPLKDYCKTFPSDFEEAYVLAQKSKAVIALRCGLIEMFSTMDKPFFVIYTHFSKRNYPTAKVLSTNTMKKLPGVNPANFHEYNTELSSEECILDEIIKKMESI